MYGLADVVELMMMKGVNVNSNKRVRLVYYMYISKINNYYIVFLKFQEVSPLYYACVCTQVAVVDKLIKHKALIDEPDKVCNNKLLTFIRKCNSIF